MKRIKQPVNWEENEIIRGIYMDETKNQIWEKVDIDTYYFSDEYVFWLEERLLESNYGE